MKTDIWHIKLVYFRMERVGFWRETADRELEEQREREGEREEEERK